MEHFSKICNCLHSNTNWIVSLSFFFSFSFSIEKQNIALLASMPLKKGSKRKREILTENIDEAMMEIGFHVSMMIKIELR